MRIGYYVHHHGAGHRVRAHGICTALRARGHEVAVFGSDLDSAADGRPLPRDNDGDFWRDATADGQFHWAPLQHAGFRHRMAIIAEWIATHQPDVFVVDVSVEVTTMVRAMGVPVVVIAQPGDRDDAPHRLGYRLATAILAPWPTEAEPCVALSRYVSKVVAVGGISRFTDQSQCDGDHLLLMGRDQPEGLDDLPHTLSIAVEGTWTTLGGDHWRDDVDDLLQHARLLVAHTGQNVVADAAALRVPLVCLPQQRPHDEQVHMARELDRLQLAALAPDTNDPAAWRRAVELADQRATGWGQWHTEGAVERAAEVIEDAAHG